MANSKPRVFVSYVHEDQDIVSHLRTELEEAGVSVWLDRHSVGAGIRWKQAIRRAIETGAVAIDVLRQMPSERSWFIPVKLSPIDILDRDIDAGETLRSLQYVELFGNWEEGIRRPLAAVRPFPSWLISLEEKPGSKSRFERFAAIEALGDAGDERAVEVLRRFVVSETDTEFLTASAGALGRLRYFSSADVVASIRRRAPDAISDLASKCMRAIAVLGSLAVPTLLELFHEGRVWVGRVAEALGTLRAREALMPIVTRLEKEADRPTRNSLISALGGMGGEEVLRCLIPLAQNPKGPKEDREWAIAALSRVDSDNARSVLISIARSPNASIQERLWAITALSRASSEKDIPILVELVRGSETVPSSETNAVSSAFPSENVLIGAAIDVMTKIGTPACVPFLVPYLVWVDCFAGINRSEAWTGSTCRVRRRSIH